MRHYETLFIINPDLNEEDHAQTVERYQDILTSQGATLLLTDDWGRRRLAYEINGFSKGHYVLFEHTAPPGAIIEMERNMRLDDKVLRFLTVKKADEFDEEAFQARQTKPVPTEEETGEAEVSEIEAEKPEEEAETQAQGEMEDEDKKEAPPTEAESEDEADGDEAGGGPESDPAPRPAEETEV